MRLSANNFTPVQTILQFMKWRTMKKQSLDCQHCAEDFYFRSFCSRFFCIAHHTCEHLCFGLIHLSEVYSKSFSFRESNTFQLNPKMYSRWHAYYVCQWCTNYMGIAINSIRNQYKNCPKCKRHSPPMVEVSTRSIILSILPFHSILHQIFLQNAT